MSATSLSCNLCWKTLEAPFILTSCDHVFCAHHRDEPGWSDTTCVGCKSHLSPTHGVRVASYDVDKNDYNLLKGVQPNTAIAIARNAVDFWNAQERNRSDYALHQVKKLERKRLEQKEKFSRAHADATRALDSERKARAREEEARIALASEIELLREKFQAEARKVHQLQEHIISLKRKRGLPADAHSAASPLVSPLQSPGRRDARVPPPSPYSLGRPPPSVGLPSRIGTPLRQQVNLGSLATGVQRVPGSPRTGLSLGGLSRAGISDGRASFNPYSSGPIHDKNGAAAPARTLGARHSEYFQ